MTESLLVTDQEYLTSIMHLLDGAKSSVDVLAFSFAIGSAGGRINFKSAPYQIAEKLIELKKKRKVDVLVYLEGVRETSDRNRVTGQFLSKAGIKIKYGSTHAKGFCVDQRYVLFGSTNLTHQSIAKNFEANLVLSGERFVKGFDQYFKHLWSGGEHGDIKLPLPFLADGDFKAQLLKTIAAAKKTLFFSIYFFDQKDIERELIKAHGRGVKISGLFHHHEAFALSYVRRTRATAKRLREAGIEDLHFGPGNLFSHSKYLVSDQSEVMLGTGNWLNEDVEIHPQLYIKMNSKPIAKQLLSHLKNQF